MKKILTTILLILVALILVTVIVIGVYLGQIVKKVVNSYGPQLTQTTVSVDTVTLSLLTGSAKVKGLVVGNPKGYTTPQAIAIGTTAVGVDPGSVLSQKIVIRSIRLESPEITFEGGLLGGNNLSQILDNVDSSSSSSGTLSTNAATQPKSEKKFEVDDLDITGGKVQVMLTGVGQSTGPMTLSLPEIHLTDLGKDDQGITAADLTRRVLNAITTATVETVAKEATNLGQNAATLKQAGQAAKQQLGTDLKSLIHQ
jgi:uncharacterized protein involved in outer membrane biogenesis